MFNVASDILFVVEATGDEPRRSMWILHPWNGDVHVRSPPIPSAPVSGPDGESIGRCDICDNRYKLNHVICKVFYPISFKIH